MGRPLSTAMVRWKSTVSKPVDVEEGNGETAALRLRQEIERAAEARKQSIIDGVPLCEDDDDFIIRVRRGSTHLNSYNWILAQATRSNMDIKVSHETFRSMNCLGIVRVYM